MRTTVVSGRNGYSMNEVVAEAEDNSLWGCVAHQSLAHGGAEGGEAIEHLVFEFGAVVDDFRPGAAFAS